MTNATVSHELRNPLNSIAAQNILKEKLYKELRLNLKGNKKCLEIITQLEEGHSIQNSSVKIMSFMI